MSLRCSGIEKRFGSNRALAGANLTVRGGTIHALLGENGAGKSTLNNIISGAMKADAGVVEIDGRAIQFASPLEAAAAGVGVVHQHFLLAEALTVAENISLGMRGSAFGLFFDSQKAEAAVTELAARTGLDVDPRARVSNLPVGLRQRVEILKALSRGAKILLLDEPTAVLAPAEIERLFVTLRALRDEGRTIVIVTHKLDEVFALASDVTVLRKGATVLESPIGGITPAELARAMIGQDPPGLISAMPKRTAESNDAPIVFTLRGVRVPGVLDVPALEIRAGEIVGIAGVEGNGQNELAGIIAGTIEHAHSIDTLSLGSRDLRPLSIRERSESGIAVIPSDRHREGLVLDMTLAENLHLRKPLIRRVATLPLLDGDAMTSNAASLLQAFGAMPAEPELPAGALSGGNQQKVIAARELSGKPLLILASNPTRGLDVGAAAEIQNRLLTAARESGVGVLLISADMEEVLALSDRVFALYRGSLTAVGSRGVSRDAVGRAMVGAE
ncbi:MAG: ABC transporter ATP-binding protein [Planctomycetota bacterium]